jgi:hypothetical protein
MEESRGEPVEAQVDALERERIIRIVYRPPSDPQRRRHTSWLKWASAGTPPEDFGAVERATLMPLDHPVNAVAAAASPLTEDIVRASGGRIEPVAMDPSSLRSQHTFSAVPGIQFDYIHSGLGQTIVYDVSDEQDAFVLGADGYFHLVARTGSKRVTVPVHESNVAINNLLWMQNFEKVIVVVRLPNENEHAAIGAIGFWKKSRTP